MNNSDFEIILDLATKGERYSAEEFAATRAAEVEMSARLTPITAEALLADGWVTTYDSPNCTAYAYRGIEYIVEVVVSPSGTHVYANDSGRSDPRHLKNVVTMYDLRELVRLLGGAQ